MPAGDVFGLDGFFLNVSNPITVSAVDINSTADGAGITVVSGVLNAAAGIATLTLSTAAGLSTTPFYVGAKIAVSGLSSSTGVAFTGYNGNFVVTGFAGTTTVSYATTGYVGGVTASITGQTGRVILVTDTAVTNTTWSSTQTHGWFGGGTTPTIVSRVDRIDFSNDTGTANIRGPLSSAKYGAATGNSNYGWFGGGTVPGSPTSISTVDRIDFSNDSSTTSPRGPLNAVRYFHTATGNSNYGWWGGGGASGGKTFIERIDFSNDSGTASLRGSIITPRAQSAATGNSNYGWFGGGTGSIPGAAPFAVMALVDRIDFSNDATTASPRGPLSLAKATLAATGNSNYGWFGGGDTPTTVSTVDRIDFSNDSSTALARGPLSSAKSQLAATGNSNYGWFGGGVNPTPARTSTVDRIDFSNDSVTASPRGPLSLARGRSTATSGQARSSSVRLQKAGNYGWFGGGLIPAPDTSSTVDRIDFSNDSVSAASVRGSLNAPTTGRRYLAATGNSNYGWFGGGSLPGSPVALYSNVDRIDFSNDSATASSRGPLSAGIGYLAATGNSNYGWFGGGFVNIPTPANISTVQRINFSNDLSQISTRGTLNAPAGRALMAATGNSNYGWFGGGQVAAPVLAIVDRIDFSNDSVSATARGSLFTARQQHAATGNSNYGWFGGGILPGTTATVERINFSNDSPSALVRGPLFTARHDLAATGNSNYGWFGGGSPGPLATVNRIDFSNDSVTASPRGTLSQSRSSLAATSNTSFS